MSREIRWKPTRIIMDFKESFLEEFKLVLEEDQKE
jgi:hypothetical protein